MVIILKEESITKISVFLDKFADILEFVRLASKCKGEVLVKSGSYIVNGKSLMGLYSLDLAKPLQVEFYGEVSFDIKEKMKNFIIG